MALKEFAEKGRVGEVEVFGDLLDREVGRFKLELGVEDDGAFDHLGNLFAVEFFDDRREVAGRKTELVGIKFDRPVGPVMFQNQSAQTAVYLFQTAKLSGFFYFVLPAAKGTDAVKQRNQQMTNDFRLHLRMNPFENTL